MGSTYEAKMNGWKAMSRSEAIKDDGYAQERAINIFLLNQEGSVIKTWRLFQYVGDNSHGATPPIHIEKGYVSGYTEDGKWLAITCGESNNLLVEFDTKKIVPD
jgi:hypothetical protein